MKFFLLTMFLIGQTFAAVYTEKVEYIPTIYPDGYCNILRRTTTYKDGKEIGSQNHRWNLEPDSDLSQFDSRVRGICRAAWTPEVVKKFKEEKTLRDIQLKKGPLQ